MLVEGDDFNEPVADHVRGVLDGHVVLSRRLASAGHFPAIEVTESVSRIRDHVISVDQRDAATDMLSLVAAYREKEDLISVGAYQPGSDAAVDSAIRLRPGINDFLRQVPSEVADFGETRARLMALAEAAHGGVNG